MKIVDLKGSVAVWVIAGTVLTGGTPAWAFDGSPRETLMQGLLGAGVGALSAEGSGGKAGTGALIGAGTQIIGGALMTLLTEPSGAGSRTTAYVQPVYTQAPVMQSYSYAPQAVAYDAQPVYVAQPVTYTSTAPSSTSSSQNILKQGLLGAGVGALSAEGSGGKAGTGAMIGAGTQIIGGALMTLLTEPAGPSAPVYAAPIPAGRTPYARSAQPTSKRIVRHYDTAGNLVSEEEFWD